MEPGGGSGDAEPRPYRIGFDVSNFDCTRSVVQYEVWGSYEDDNSPIEDLECSIQFSDGGSVSSCFGTYELAGGITHAGVVTAQPAGYRGEPVVLERNFYVYEPPFITAQVSAPACGLEVSYSVERSDMSAFTVNLAPPEKLVSHDREAGKFVVSEPGLYSVQLYGEQERTNGPICDVSETHEVEVRACDDHEHDPGCGH